MRCNYIREKKYQCGDDYMAVGVFSIIPQEHRGRGKKRKESSEGQKAKNKMDSLRKRQRKALTNFSPAGMFLTGTYEDPFLPEDILDILAAELRKHLDMKKIYDILEQGI